MATNENALSQPIFEQDYVLYENGVEFCLQPCAGPLGGRRDIFLFYQRKQLLNYVFQTVLNISVEKSFLIPTSHPQGNLEVLL